MGSFSSSSSSPVSASQKACSAIVAGAEDPGAIRRELRVIDRAVPAPVGGIYVSISVDNTSLLAADAYAFVPTGSTTGVFYAEALASGTANITATMTGSSKAVPLVITP